MSTTSTFDRKKGKEFSKVCRYFVVGNCKNENCTFIHPDETTDWSDLPISSKRSQVPCRNVKQFGFCKFEEKCPFNHHQEDLVSHSNSAADSSSSTTGWKKVKAKKMKSPAPQKHAQIQPIVQTINPSKPIQPPALEVPITKGIELSHPPRSQIASLLLDPLTTNFDNITISPPPSYTSLIARINMDDPELWSLPALRDPETLVMYREMTLWGLDRNNELDYVKYFEKKQKLALHQASLDYLVKNEMEVMKCPDLLTYYEMKKQMVGHSRQQEEWCKEEMGKLGLKWRVPSDYTTYYGIKMDIAANVEDEAGEMGFEVGN